MANSDLLIGEELTIENPKTLEKFPESEEILPVNENPVTKTCLMENPSGDFDNSGEIMSKTAGISDDCLTINNDEISKTVEEVPDSTELLIPASDGKGLVVDDAQNVNSLKEITGTTLLESPVSDCCETTGIVDAPIAKTVPETMQLTIPVVSSESIVSDDAHIVKTLDETPETMQLEIPVLGSCETVAIVGGSSLVSDAHVAKVLKETAVHGETVKAFISKLEDVQLGKSMEECNTKEGENVENVKSDKTRGSSGDDDKDAISLNEIVENSGKLGQEDGSDSNDDDPPYDYEDNCRMMGLHPNLYFNNPDFPYPHDPRMTCSRRYLDGGTHKPMSRYKHNMLMMNDPIYRMEYNMMRERRRMHYMDDEKHDMLMERDSYYRFHYEGICERRRIHNMDEDFDDQKHFMLMRKDGYYRYHYEKLRECRRMLYMDEEVDYHGFGNHRFMSRGYSYIDRWSDNSSRGCSQPEPEPEPETETEPCHVGAGLYNLGNTCFLNAVIQCFTHTVPLVEGLQSLKHEESIHGKDDFCVLCAVRNQIECSLASSGKKIFPTNLVENLNHISSDFRRHQQEDAHEFLYSLLDKLDTNWCTHEASIGEPSSNHDSLVKQIFGGNLVSQLCCSKCGHTSDSYESLIDLSLEVEEVDDLESAFKSFTKEENIEDITCDNCKEKVVKGKQLLIDKAPPVAALHLKRFKSDGVSVEKVDRVVKYPLELDLAPYAKGITEDDNGQLKYELYGFVVHVGISPVSGHYFSYLRTSPDAWYRFDDSKVKKVSESTALDQEAYILFYAKKGTPWFTDMLDGWKTRLEEKSNSSLKSVLDPTNNLPSSCQDSDQKDLALVTLAEPLSCVKLDEDDKEIPISAQEPSEANTNELSPIISAEDNPGENNKNDDTERTKSETLSTSNVENPFVDGPKCDDGPKYDDDGCDDDVDINPCISPERGTKDQIPLDHLRTEETPCLSLKRRLGKPTMERRGDVKRIRLSFRPFARYRYFLSESLGRGEESNTLPRSESESVLNVLCLLS